MAAALFWRVTLAEQSASSIDEFFDYVSLEASGTYMNGCVVVDIKTNEIALIEISYKNFVYFKPDRNGGYAVIMKPEGISKEYDTDYIYGNARAQGCLSSQHLSKASSRPEGGLPLPVKIL